jgi:hypothetical protein
VTVFAYDVGVVHDDGQELAIKRLVVVVVAGKLTEPLEPSSCPGGSRKVQCRVGGWLRCALSGVGRVVRCAGTGPARIQPRVGLREEVESEQGQRW